MPALNTDLSQRIVQATANMDWIASPMAGVERRRLERASAESGRATSVVRYAPGSRFSDHAHPGGEEILVLSGVFSDETGHFPTGTYLRNPPGSHHSPYSDGGCELFVKLHQFHVDDHMSVRVDTHKEKWLPGIAEGLSVMPLHSVGTEQTALVRWAPGTRFRSHRHWGGEEILVLEGVFQDEHGRYPAGSWLRSPHLSAHSPLSDEGCLIFVKTGHLTAPASPWDNELPKSLPHA